MSNLSKLYSKRLRGRQQLRIGKTENDEQILIPYKAREAHLHVIGRTRSGKSRFLADLIIQDITNRNGLCVLDPHNELVSYVLSWIVRNKPIVRGRQVHLVDFTSPTHTFCFNPLQIDHPDEAYSAAELLTETMSRVFGNSATDTPLIDSNLNTIFVMLAQQGLPLAAALNFTQSDFALERERIVANHHDPYYRSLGEELCRIEPGSREWRETMASTERRLRQFLGRPLMRELFSQTENTISFRQAMDEGHVLLFGLKPNELLGVRSMRAISMLLTGTLVDAAFSRDEADSPRPFFAYLDEVQTMLTDDADRILSECSKFGLYLTASHQYLDQLEHQGSQRIKSAIMANTLLKAVFATSQKDAMEFVDEAFADRIDFQKIKEELKAPHVVGHRRARFSLFSLGLNSGTSQTTTVGQADANTIGQAQTRARSGSDSYSYGGNTSDAETLTTGNSNSWGDTHSQGAVWRQGEYDKRSLSESIGATRSRSESSSHSHAHSSNNNWSETHNTSWSASDSDSSSQTHTDSRSVADGTSFGTTFSVGVTEGLEPIIKWFSTQTWTLEEQRYEPLRVFRRLQIKEGLEPWKETTDQIAIHLRHAPEPFGWCSTIKVITQAKLRRSKPLRRRSAAAGTLCGVGFSRTKSTLAAKMA